MRDRLADAWLDANIRLVRANPKGWYAEQGDAVALVNECGISELNMAASIAVAPELAALDAMAAELAGSGVPWSVLVRAEAADAVAGLAARHGLTNRHDVVMMVCTAGDAMLDADDDALRSVQRVGSAASDAYATALAGGFEIPTTMLGSMVDGGVLDAAGFAAYLATVDGQPVASGLGVDGAGVVGVYNIAVVPPLRRRGLGRAMTAKVMADGFAGGADTAYLQASTAGRALYESMGFRRIDAWTRFTKGDE